MTNDKTIPPPRGLSAEARRWWRRLLADYEDWSAGDLLMLEGALQAFDRWSAARKLIDADGVMLEDRFGQQRPHPAVGIERDSRAACMKGLKQLSLEDEAERLTPSEAGRRAALVRWQKKRSA